MLDPEVFSDCAGIVLWKKVVLSCKRVPTIFHGVCFFKYRFQTTDINGGICMLGIVCLVLRRPALRQATKSFRPCTKASVNQTKSCVTQLGHQWQRVHSVSVERVSVPTATLKMTEM